MLFALFFVCVEISKPYQYIILRKVLVVLAVLVLEPTGVHFWLLILRFTFVHTFMWSCHDQPIFPAILTWKLYSWFLWAWKGASLLKNIFPRQNAGREFNKHVEKLVIFWTFFSFFRFCFTRCNPSWHFSLGGGWTDIFVYFYPDAWGDEVIWVILLMEEILHRLIGLSVYPIIFLHPRWLTGFLPSTVCFKWVETTN